MKLIANIEILLGDKPRTISYTNHSWCVCIQNSEFRSLLRIHKVAKKKAEAAKKKKVDDDEWAAEDEELRAAWSGRQTARIRGDWDFRILTAVRSRGTGGIEETEPYQGSTRDRFYPHLDRNDP